MVAVSGTLLVKTGIEADVFLFVCVRFHFFSYCAVVVCSIGFFGLYKNQTIHLKPKRKIVRLHCCAETVVFIWFVDLG